MPVSRSSNSVDWDAINAAIKAKLRQLVEGGGGVGTTSAGPTIRPPTTYEKYVQPIADPVLNTARKVAGFMLGDTPEEQAMSSALSMMSPLGMAAQRIAPPTDVSRVSRAIAKNLFLAKGQERRALSPSRLDTLGLTGERLDSALAKGKDTYLRLRSESNPARFNPDHLRRQIEAGIEGKDWYGNILSGSRKYLGTDADPEWFALNSVGSWNTRPAGQTTKALVPKVAKLRGATPAEAARWGGMPNQRDAMEHILGGDITGDIEAKAAKDVGGRKNLNYFKNQSGDLDAVTADRHIGRDWGMYEYDRGAQLRDTAGKPVTGGWVRYKDSGAGNKGVSLTGHRTQSPNSLMPHEYDLVEDVLPVLSKEFNLKPAEGQAAEWLSSKRWQKDLFDKINAGGGQRKGGSSISWQDAPINEHLAARWKEWMLPDAVPGQGMTRETLDTVWNNAMLDKNLRGDEWKKFSGGKPLKDVLRMYRPEGFE